MVDSSWRFVADAWRIGGRPSLSVFEQPESESFDEFGGAVVAFVHDLPDTQHDAAH